MITPLGAGTEQNLEVVLRGESRLSLHHDVHGTSIPEPFMGSLLETLPEREGYTPFEALCIEVATPAISRSGLDVTGPDTVFILSTTKGNIWSSPAESARKVALFFGNRTTPVVVSTACTSGVAAQLTAYRLLSAGTYNTAVLIGCDIQTLFVVSGFQSFKALSLEPCRPFDAARQGLNAGEAAACMILSSTRSKGSEEISRNTWHLLGGSIHNDANHISGPSRTAEGSLRCLKDCLKAVADPACISVHGTGTLYNDEMEALAIHRAGLDTTPVSALKGFYGHCMGAAGLLETILTIHALDRGLILPVRGFSKQGTTSAVNVSPEARPTDGHSFIKLLSGFGGVNAAVAWSRGVDFRKNEYTDARTCAVASVSLDASCDLVAEYRALGVAYPKFFKMDTLSRLGFVAVEILLSAHPSLRESMDPEHTALILANRSASLANDCDYEATISDPANYFPSPALFVYTLPNIVTGELAIRHGLFGETAFFILEKETDLQPIIDATFRCSDITSAIVGWLECTDKTHYEAHLRFVKNEKKYE